MINQEHLQKVAIRQRLDELHRLWELLLSKLAEKGMRLQQALVLSRSIPSSVRRSYVLDQRHH